MLLDKIPHNADDAQLSADQYGEQQAALEKALTELWKGQYKIVGKRFFLYKERPQWVVLDSSTGNHIQDELGGKREFAKTGAAGFDGVSVWKIGLLSPQRVAVAMGYDRLPDGGAVYGYFEVEKE
ncbi:hypothetical protein [Pseudomonas sp. CGJS7]|uniref:hypothetical protein n=1 Tax=Pseudomonas sp. CGJS7 TaxID=3109348 RepID=UPI00300987DB